MRRCFPSLLVCLLVSGSACAGSLERATAATFTAESLTGRILDLDSLRVRGPVILDFWATWCKPCAAEFVELQSLQNEFQGRGLTVIGISVDGPRNLSKVRPFVASRRIGFSIVLDEDSSLQEKFQVQTVPTTLLIDPTGVIAERHEGYEPGDLQEMKRLLLRMLPAASNSDSAPAPAR